MKSKARKIPAFALQEMMVVLAITSIVVGMVFSVLRLVQNQMGDIKEVYQIKLEANKLRQSLWVDFNRYSHAHYNATKGELYLSNEMNEKMYYFQKNQIVTQGDTLMLPLDLKLFYFDNKEVFNGEVDAIQLKTNKASGNQQIFVFKNNSPVTYINNNP